LDGADAKEIEAKANKLAMALRDKLNRDSRLREDIDVLGPAPSPIYKLRNRYRWQLLLKGRHISKLRTLALHAQAFAPNDRRVRLHIDVDPVNML
jgi:primosomal protein N' (replication factor Y)